MVTAEMKAKVNAKLRECIEKANKRYSIDLKFPTVVYNKRGTVAGTASFRSWTIDINPILLVENFEDMLNDTVPHEMAHLITDKVYPEAHKSGPMQWTSTGLKRGKRSLHGDEWKSVMRTLGVSPSRCHQYDTTNAKTRTKASYDYKCTCCGAVLKMGPKRHAQQQRTPGWYTHSSCGRQRGQLVMVTSGKEPTTTIHINPVQLKPVMPNAPTAPAQGSKLSRCMELYSSLRGQLSRKDMITQFVKQCECTQAGASTYYATCKARLG